jgi:hypothetical protein
MPKCFAGFNPNMMALQIKIVGFSYMIAGYA